MRLVFTGCEFKNFKKAHYDLMSEYVFILTYLSNLSFFTNSIVGEYINRQGDLPQTKILRNLLVSEQHKSLKNYLNYLSNYLWLSVQIIGFTQKPLVIFLAQYHIYQKISYIKRLYIFLEACINSDLSNEAAEQKLWLRQAIRECERITNTSKPVNHLFSLLISSFPFLSVIGVLTAAIPAIINSLFKNYSDQLLNIIKLFMKSFGVTDFSLVLIYLFIPISILFLCLEKSFSYKRAIFLTNSKNRSLLKAITFKNLIFRLEEKNIEHLEKSVKNYINDGRPSVYSLENRLFEIWQESKREEFPIDLLSTIIWGFLWVIFFSLTVIFFTNKIDIILIFSNLFSHAGTVFISLFFILVSCLTISYYLSRWKSRCYK